MRYFKTTKNGYIYGIGTGSAGDEINEEEYNAIMAIILSKPARTDTFDYRLKIDLTWEEFEITPPEPEEPSIDDKAEAYDILTGVSE